MNLFTKQKQTHRHRKQIYGYQREQRGRWGESVSRSVVSDFLRPPWTVAHQAPLSMEFSRQEYWSGQPFPSPEHLPIPGLNPGLLPLPSEPPGKPQWGGVGETNQEFRTDIYTLLYINQANKDLLYSTGNYIPHLVIIYNGKEYMYRFIYSFISL